MGSTTGTGGGAPGAASPVAVLYATESGNAEGLAKLTAARAAEAGLTARVASLGELAPADLTAHEVLLVVAATAGEGEPPEQAVAFFAALRADDAPRLDGIRFAVLALGDQAYPNFCGFGNALDPRLAALGATRLADLVECDFDFDEPASAWIKAVVSLLAADAPATGAPRTRPRGPGAAGTDATGGGFSAEVLRTQPLSGPLTAPDAAQLTLCLDGSGITYEPGDVVTVLPSNDPEVVAALLEAASCPADEATVDELLHRREVTTLTPPVVRRYAELTGDADLAALLDDPERLRHYLDHHWVVDLLEDHPARLAPEQLLSLLRPLPPRSYSVASSQRASSASVDLVVARVSWQVARRRAGGERAGVAGSHLVRRGRAGERLTVTHRSNPSFHLPDDPERPVVMIGPGTGVAPFRGFLQEREVVGARGPTWLFSGHRHAATDHWYRDEWERLLRRGVLTRLDLAFSRDQEQKVYVQDRLHAARAELRGWVDDGAVLYVCGSRAMADDVERALVEVLGAGPDDGSATLAGLRASGRYAKDVY